MLTRLVIQDVVLIDKLTLSFASGLNVFTGETGAGKSIVLDALGLALGARSDAGLIRNGASQACVTAEFSSLPPSLYAKISEENGLEIEEPVLLRRVVAKDGKSRAFLNDQAISISLLKKIGEELLEIHGQFETHGLLNPGTHIGLLDAFGGYAALLHKVAAAYAAWRQATQARESHERVSARAKAEEEFLRAAVSELDELAPEEGETEKLAEKRTGLQHREKIMEALQTAMQSLDGERGAIAAVTAAGKALARVADKAAGLRELLATIDRLSTEVGEASHQLARYADTLEADSDTLQRIEERLFALRAVARKHGVAAEGLPEFHQELRGKLALLSDKGDQLAAMAKAERAARSVYMGLAQELSGKRKKASVELIKLIQRELPPLKLENARFVVNLETLDEGLWHAGGMDRVMFLATTNPGAPAGALHKVASGGELARFMLALKVVLAASDPVPVLVFDEIDVGIGGATASAVGERLARLAKDIQVLVVTHSPQVAARGHNHLRVLKELKGKQAVTVVQELGRSDRVEEIARMLAGAKVTDSARQAAMSLLEDSLTKKRRAS